MIRALLIALAFAVSACESNYEFQQPLFTGSTGTVANPSNELAKEYYECAAWLRGIDPPGTAPKIRRMNKKWLTYYGEIASGAYVADSNIIYVAPGRDSDMWIIHEEDHALSAQLGEKVSEHRAHRRSYWWRDCLMFDMSKKRYR